MSSSHILILFLWALLGLAQSEEWAKTVDTRKFKTTTLQFFVSSNTSSVVLMSQAANTTGYIDFGTLIMADDKIMMGPDPDSKLVGRTQGLYGTTSRDEMVMIMAASYSFTEGMYNGSTISIMGRSPFMHTQRELPAVGGTGVFRMAKGYALLRNYLIDFDTGVFIIGYNVTLFH